MTRCDFRRALCFALLFFFGVSTPAFCDSVTIGDATVQGSGSGTVDITLTNDTEVEGFVLAIGYDPDDIDVTNVDVSDFVNDDVGAELVVAEVFDVAGGFTLGVVLDSTAPFDGQTIPTGTGQDLAFFDFTSKLNLPEGDEETVPLSFVDGVFNSPALNNILVQGGESMSIGLDVDDDIEGIEGEITIEGTPPDELTFSDGAEIPAFGVGCIDVILKNVGAVQGFVLSVEHVEEELNLISVDVAGVADSVGAEFVIPNIYADGGTLAVVLDFETPFNGQTIPPGDANIIAEFCYECDVTPPPGGLNTEHELVFVDSKFGTPPLDNVIVVGGLSRTPLHDDIGTITCIAPPEQNTKFFCGVQDDEGNIVDVEAAPGEMGVELCVFYCDPDDNIQGFQISMKVCDEFQEDLCFVDGSFTIEDTILEAVGTEFLNQSQDCDLDDLDGIEQTVGILLDALPPFEDQTVPPTSVPLKVGAFQVDVSENAECGDKICLEFVDGLNGSEALPVDNLVVMDFQGIKGFTKNSCNVCVVAANEFKRSDCNLDSMINIADAAAMLGLQFQDLDVGCEDACDANDDEKINLADTVYTLNYLFKSGDEPPAPGPIVAGPDPEGDELGCEDGIDPCL